MTKKNKVKDSKLEEESIQKLSGVEDVIKEADQKIIISLSLWVARPLLLKAYIIVK
mgnify:CR=1 FL=1